MSWLNMKKRSDYRWAPGGFHFERPRTPARRSGRLRTYRPGGRPPSGSGTARSSGPSGLREGGGAGNPSQRGTQRNRKGSPGRTKTTSRSHGPLRQSEGSEDNGAPRGNFCVVGGAQTEGAVLSALASLPTTSRCGSQLASAAQALCSSQAPAARDPRLSGSSAAGPRRSAASLGLRGSSVLKLWDLAWGFFLGQSLAFPWLPLPTSC
ncbi:uncharacterized protein [Chlorocebus sabaeus]|uniref:uncharacterized protein n=1 Tax=Chlorocebus sabaeus TaxID=60711 RepID=UPI003BFA17D3